MLSIQLVDPIIAVSIQIYLLCLQPERFVQIISCQDITVYTMGPLQAACSIWGCIFSMHRGLCCYPV